MRYVKCPNGFYIFSSQIETFGLDIYAHAHILLLANIRENMTVSRLVYLTILRTTIMK